MARCYQCGIQTELYREGETLCESCQVKARARSYATIDHLNARLTEARENYRKAVGLQAEAFELKRSLPVNHSDGILAVQKATADVEQASVRFREALREFVTTLSKRSD